MTERYRSCDLRASYLTLNTKSMSIPDQNLHSRPFIQTTEVQPDGTFKKPSQAEQVLNWHTQNAEAQNKVLSSIDQKIDKVNNRVKTQDQHLLSMDKVFRDMYSDLQTRIAKLDTDLHRYINQGYNGPEFNLKEREIRQLKTQLDQMNRDRIHSATTSSYQKPYTQPFFSTSPPYSPPPPPDDSQFFKSTGELFKRYPPLSQPTQPRQKPESSSLRKNKQPAPDSYDPVLSASIHRHFHSDEDSDVHSLQSS
ncbi:hypothetical protein Q3G72_010738 [Acer saccharum]|nr:hypothetical protein Q3G72_010738 [Acer saccharum]